MSTVTNEQCFTRTSLGIGLHGAIGHILSPVLWVNIKIDRILMDINITTQKRHILLSPLYLGQHNNNSKNMLKKVVHYFKVLLMSINCFEINHCIYFVGLFLMFLEF